MTVMHEPSDRHLSTSTPRAARIRRIASVAVVIVACMGFALMHLLGAGASASPTKLENSTAEAAPAFPQTDFSKFTHTNPEHARLPCLLCHRREDNSPRPVRSAGHTPCSGCHTQQFSDASSPICTICHANPQSSAVKAFPSLRSFNVRFDHATHARGGAQPRQSCATCHKPARRGVALSIPAGTVAHTTCFQCHAPQAQAGGRDISSCGTCHRIGSYARTPEMAASYRVNFDHSEHTSKGIACAECHSVRAGVSQRRQVTAPLPLMHHAPRGAKSCMSCHDDKRAFGVNDFSKCKRCHEGNAWHF